MKSVLNFFSLLAFGLVGAAVLVIGTPVVNKSWSGLVAELPTFDYLSVAVGLCLGLVIGMLAQVSWSDVSQRTSHTLRWHIRRLVLLALAASVVAAMLSY